MDYLEPNFHHFHQQHHDQLSQAVPYSEHNAHIYLNTMAQHSGMMGIPTTKTNETKPRLGKEEVEILEREFKKNPKPTTQTKKQYADDMDVELARINNWFQNRRAKRKQEKKQEAYELQQGQEAAGYSEPSSPDFYNGGFADAQFLPLQHANTFPIMSGPPQPAAPYNPQYADPTTASMESLQRTMAAAQASYGPQHQEFQGPYQDPNETFEHFGGPALSGSDQAQFPAVNAAVTQFNEQRSFSFPSSVPTSSLYTHSNPSITDLHASPIADTPTHFNNYSSAHQGSEASGQQSMAAFPSQLLPEQPHDSLPISLHGSYDSQSPQDSSSAAAQAIGFKFETIDQNDPSPPAPTIPFKSPPPMDIASRRKKVAVKPAALTADSIKGRPPMGPRTVSHADNLRRSSDSPLGSPMRRVMSAGGMRSIVSGRISKGGIESAQRSPINLGGFSDAGSFMEHNYHTIRQPPSLTAGSSLNCSLSPPTPMSPRGGEMTLSKREGNRLTESPSHGGLSFMYNEGISGFYPTHEGDQNLASPPETPQAQLALHPSTSNSWSTENDIHDKQWAFEVPDEPLYTPAQDGFQLEMQMPQPSYLNAMSQPVTPAFGQNFNPNYMFGVPEESEYRHESPRYMLPSSHEYSFPDNMQHNSRLSTSPMSKQKTFQFSNQTPADFSEKK